MARTDGEPPARAIELRMAGDSELSAIATAVQREIQSTACIVCSDDMQKLFRKTIKTNLNSINAPLILAAGALVTWSL